MKHIRSLILALVFSTGLAPAFAQAPPPVPALPDAERRTSYVISGTTCACAIGFQLYQDSTDVANWLKVYVNGVEVTQAGNWNITSPSGSISTLPRPISDAVLTFTAVRTGTVQIVGAQRPRRLSEYSESRGVAARDLNQAINGIEAQLREMWDRQFRTVQAPPGETLAILPPQSGRASMGACFDSSGNLGPCIAAAGSFVAGTGIGFTGSNPTTISYTGATYSAGAGITFSGSNPTVIKANVTTTGYVLPSDFGIVCDGVTNVTTAFQTMVTASSGKTIYIPAGPACVINAHINLISNIVIVGGGRDVSGIKMTGQDYIFAINNIDNVTIKDLYLLGTDSYTSWAASPVGAINIQMTASHSNFTFKGLKLSAFNASYWILGQQTTAGTISNTTFDDILIVSTVADVPTDGVPTNNTNYVMALYSGTGGLRWENTTITNWQITMTGICFGPTLFSNHYKWNISNNRILSPGGANTGGHCTNGLGGTNAYGILIYDLNSDGNPPSSGIIARNFILSPIAAGIYVVGDGVAVTRAANSTQILIVGNEIVSQTHTDVLLPRGGIVVNLSTDLQIVGNQLYNNAIGINIASQNAGDVSILSNHCYSGAGGSLCLSMTSGANGSSNTDRRTVRSNFFDGLLTAATFASQTGARFNLLDISGNAIFGGTNAISFANQWVSGTAVFTNNHVSGTSSFASLTGSITLMNNSNLSLTAAQLPAATNGSSMFVSDGTPATACTAAGTGSTGFRQNGAWKCF